MALAAAAALSFSSGVDPIVLAGVAVVSASVGGLFGYAIGRRYGARIVRWQPVQRRIGHRMAELRSIVSV